VSDHNFLTPRDESLADDEEAGLAFLEENKAKEGVITLPSGLQYKVLVEGGGVEHPTVSSPCECHYAGRLLDGTEFDSSYKRGQPTTFAPNQVIKGWTEAMQLMVQGDKWEMYIPYQLAYGAAGKPPKIPAKAMLIFVMEIVKIKGDTVPRKLPYPEWTEAELALWLDKDEAACTTWREGRLQKWEAGDEKLKSSYPTREALDAWLDGQCLNSRNKSLWKRTRAAKKMAEAPTPPPAAPAMTPKFARTLLDQALAAFTVPENKSKLTAIVAECEAAPPESQMMMRMSKIMPAVQEMMTKPLEEAGFRADDLMSVMMQIRSFEAQDPSIAADCAKLTKAVMGDLSDFA